MIVLDLVGLILKSRALGLNDDEIVKKAEDKSYGEALVKEAMEAIENDEILVVNSLMYLTPVNPVTYSIGMHRVTVEKRIIWGLFKNTQEIGIRTIDSVRVEEKIIDADIIIVHADQSEVRIEKISKKDARSLQKFFGYVIEAQRAKVLNVASD